MTKKQRYEIILSYFRQEMPEADTELEFGSIYGQAHQSGDARTVSPVS